MKSKGMINITGASESRVAPVIRKILLEEETKGQCLVVVPSYIRAKRLATDLSFFVGKNINMYVLPPEEEGMIRYEAKNHDQLFMRLKILKALRSGEKCIIIAPATGAIKKLPPHAIYDNSSMRLTCGEDIDMEQVKEKLIYMGYERAHMVETRGEFSIRGSIIDIFTCDGEYPYRIEMFDTEVDSIRSFDPESQRSVENLKYIEVYPAEQILKDRSVFDIAA